MNSPKYDEIFPPSPAAKSMPYSFWWPLVCGALAGLLIRLVYMGDPGGRYSAMMASFIYLSPFVVGMVTVHVAERSHRRSWGYYAWASAIANLLYVLGSLVTLFEGIICAVIILPLFALIGALGGLLMGLVCRLTNWPRGTLYSVAALPLVLGAFVATPVPDSASLQSVHREVLVQAPPEQVWRHLLDADAIAPAEVEEAWMYRIGVPKPLAGVTEETPEGLVRDVRQIREMRFPVFHGGIGPLDTKGRARMMQRDVPVECAGVAVASGDLVFFGRKGQVDHVGIYVGEGRFVHAPSTGGTVRLDRLDNRYWARQSTTFRRP